MDDELEVLDEVIFEEHNVRRSIDEEDLTQSKRKKSITPKNANVTDVDEIHDFKHNKRLIIERVVLNNFKSYGGTRVIGPYHKRFTSIIGPNGSGKSNIIDAMLFVFGFGAKQMRFKNVSELIHNSAAYKNKNNGKPLDKMSVSIHFIEIIDKNPDKEDFEIVPGSELIITREAFHDGTSKYKLNGLISSKKNIVTALKDRQMDLVNNRFLILQGEVEQIAQMKPKGTKPDEEGLLEYLEDTIGTKNYHEEINELTAECSKLQDELTDKKTLYEASNKEIEEMLIQKEKVDKYLELDKEILKLEILIIHNSLAKLKTAKEAKSSELQKIKEESEEFIKIINDLDSQKASLHTETETLETQLQDAHASFKEFKSKFQKLCSVDEELRLHLNRDVNKIKEKTKTIENLKKKIIENDKKNITNLENIDKLLNEIPRLESDLEKSDKDLENTQNLLKNDIEKATSALSEAEKSLSSLQQELDSVLKELNNLHTQRELSLQKTESSEKELSELENSINNTANELADNKNKLEDSTKNLEEIKIQISSKKSEISQISKNLEEEKKNYKTLKIAFESQKMEQNVGFKEKQEQFLRSLSNKGMLNGFYGKLSDLFTIDSKYEKALMVAAGGSMDNFVVETPEVASKIFEHLRKKKIGRASVMALTIIEKSKGKLFESVKNKFDQKEFGPSVKRLIDLINPSEEKFKICFFHILGETLVTDNSDEAFDIGYNKRRKIVTLEGELIEADGRLSGGGSTKRVISDKSSSNQIDIKQVNEVEAKLISIQSEYSNIKNEIDKLISNEEETTNKVVLLKQLIENDTTSLSKYKERRDSLKNQIKEVKITISTERIDAEIEEFENLKKEKEKNVKNVETKANSLRKALDNVGDGKLKEAKEKYKNCQEQLNSKLALIDSLRNTVTSAKADTERFKSQCSKLEIEITNHKKSEAEINNKLDNVEKEAAEAKKVQDKIDLEIKIKEDCVIKNKAKLEEIEKQHSEFNLKSLEITHSLQTLSKAIAELETEISAKTENGENLASMYKKSSELLLESKTLTEEYKNIDNPNKVQKMKKIDPSELTIEEIDIKAASAQIDEKKKQLQQMDVNISIVTDFRNKIQILKKKLHEMNTVAGQYTQTSTKLEDLCTKRKVEFLQGFGIIATKLKEMYQAITFGGDAELELLDSTDPFTEGILFSVRPAKKSWKQIQNLSGGEKTLSSLALVFALHHYKPNPVYFMDEIDAALDYRNERTKNAQFIIISLRSQMFEQCNRMIGVYKTFSVTKTVSIDPCKYNDIYENENNNEQT